MPIENITFDEEDLECIFNAITFQLKNTSWNVTDSYDWLTLKQLKSLEDKINLALDMMSDMRHQLNSEEDEQ